MKKVILLTALVSSTALADYQWELEAGLGHTELSSRSSFSSSSYRDGSEMWGLSGTYYLDEVSTQNVPLSDAGFLSKSSFLNLSTSKQKNDEQDLLNVDLQGVWVLPRGWFAGVSFTNFEVDDGEEDFKQSGPGVILGSYIGDGSAIQLHYQKTEHDYSDPGFGPDYDQSDREIYTLSYKNVVTVDGRAHTDIEIDLSKTNYWIELHSTLGWYIGNQFKYGTEILVSDYDTGIDRQSVGLWLEYFIAESFALSAHYTWLKGEEVDFGDNYRVEEETIVLSAKYRF